MKANLLKNWKGATRIALLSLIAVLSVITTTGCGKKKNGNDQAGYYGYGANPNCANCNNGANSLLSSAYGTTDRSVYPLRMAIGLEFYGTGGVATTQYPGGYSDPYQRYNGPVQAQGRMKITAADPYCGILPQHVGDYTLSTQQAGQVEGNIVYDLILQASGPYPFTIKLSRTMINDTGVATTGFDGRQYPKRLQNDIYINNCRYVIE